ncbi:MAG: AgmX/PglI C-terminal domain-containing protein [bacterium]|nr:AgmX/PglI C-terminal domain-containing protein [bacterium]
MRWAVPIVLFFMFYAALADTEIRVAQVADEEVISITGPAVESESRLPNRINAKIHDLSSRLRYVYQEYLDAGGRVEGSLVLRFTIQEDGYVCDMEVVEESLRNQDLVDALVDKVSHWFFVPNRDEKHPGQVTCEYPFVFSNGVRYSPLDVRPLQAGAELHPRRRPYWIDKDINPQLRELEDIYDVYLLGNPSLSGTITFEFVIHDSGTVDRVSILENTTGAVSLAGDVATKIAGWKFSALEDSDTGHDVVVTYPIYFGSGRADEPSEPSKASYAPGEPSYAPGK